MSALPKLKAVEVPRTGVLKVAWADGPARLVDVSGKLRGHPLLVALREPDLFARAAIDEFGAGVAWPNGADFCADALRIWADEQQASTRQTA